MQKLTMSAHEALASAGAFLLLPYQNVGLAIRSGLPDTDWFVGAALAVGRQKHGGWASEHSACNFWTKERTYVPQG
jgi:hypothetical protein